MLTPKSFFTDADVAVGAGWTTIKEIVCVGYGQVSAEITNEGGSNAFTDFQVQGLSHQTGTWFTHKTGPQVESDVTPITLAAAGISNIEVPCHGLYAIRLQAKSASETTAAARGRVVAGGETEAMQVLERTLEMDNTMSSGTTPLATTGNDAVAALGAQADKTLRTIMFINDGTVSGFCFIGGTESADTLWHRLPGGATVIFENLALENQALSIQRIAGGSNLADVFVSVLYTNH